MNGKQTKHHKRVLASGENEITHSAPHWKQLKKLYLNNHNFLCLCFSCESVCRSLNALLPLCLSSGSGVYSGKCATMVNEIFRQPHLSSRRVALAVSKKEDASECRHFMNSQKGGILFDFCRLEWWRGKGGFGGIPVEGGDVIPVNFPEKTWYVVLMCLPRRVCISFVEENTKRHKKNETVCMSNRYGRGSWGSMSYPNNYIGFK